jgi:hypothetical protein
MFEFLLKAFFLLVALRFLYIVVTVAFTMLTGKK